MGDTATLLEPDTCEGTLAIGAVSLFTPAWWICDMSEINDAPTLRGADVAVPGGDDEPQARVATSTVRSFPLVIAGDRNRLGVPYADPAVGLLTNWEYLWNNVIKPPGTTAGTRAAVWTWPDGTTTRVADVHVIGCRKTRLPGHLYFGRLELSVPAPGTFDAP